MRNPFAHITSLMAFLWITPLLLWFVIATVADTSDYLVLIRSGFLLLGLGLGIGWGLLRKSHRFVLFGLGLALLGYFTFARVSSLLLGVPGQAFSLHDPIPWQVRFGFGHQIVTGLPFGHVAALSIVLINIVMAQKRFQLGRVVVSNLLVCVAIYIMAAALGAY